jgi:hypothetical protein
MLGDQQQRLHRGQPFFGVVFGLGQLGDVEGGVAQGDQLLAVRQFDRFEKSLIPRQRFYFFTFGLLDLRPPATFQQLELRPILPAR